MKKFILTFLALIILPTQAFALSCVGPQFSRDLELANTVFEGHITKIETIPGQEHINKITAIADKAYAGVGDGEEITIYQKHWMHTEKPWQESESDKKAGIFTLRKIKSADINLGFPLEEEIYLVGMCSGPFWINDPQYQELLDEKFSN